LSAGTVWHDFAFSTPAALTSGNTYAIVVLGDSSFDWRGDSTSSTYADGKACYDSVAPKNGESWVCVTTDDLMFRTYTEEEPSTTTYATTTLDSMEATNGILLMTLSLALAYLSGALVFKMIYV